MPRDAAFAPTFSHPASDTPVVRALNSQARQTFETDGLPTSRDEEWRFTPVSRVLATAFTPADAARAELDGHGIDEAVRLVLVNGRPDLEASDLVDLPAGVTVMPLEQAVADHEALVEARLGQLATAEDHAFVALNTAQELRGAFVHIAASTEIERPIHLVNLTAGVEAVTYPRTLVVVEQDARVTLVEGFAGTGDTLSCPVTEIFVGPNANVKHVRLQEEDRRAHHLGAVGTRLERDANYALTSVFMGGDVSRVDLFVDLVGPGAHAALDGLTLGRERQHGTHQVRLRHLVPDCTSEQRFRSVVADRSHAVFTGRIVVAQDAQKTDAIQSSRALLLSDTAVATNNPQLEIYADDVKCTHGSTVGELDAEALFYMRTRGLSREAAEALLTIAFAAEVLEAIPVESIRTRLETELGHRLGGERTFEEV
jgi:Fe-S cluster assembly protein SufD